MLIKRLEAVPQRVEAVVEHIDRPVGVLACRLVFYPGVVLQLRDDVLAGRMYVYVVALQPLYAVYDAVLALLRLPYPLDAAAPYLGNRFRLRTVGYDDRLCEAHVDDYVRDLLIGLAGACQVHSRHPI